MKILNFNEYFIFENIHNNKSSKDLFNVGKNKPVGYLPLRTIVSKEYGGDYEDIDEWKKYAKKNNLKIKIIKTGDTGSGALYLYDSENLQLMLDEYKDKISHILPLTPDEYIDFIEHNMIPEYVDKNVFIFIGLTFNDSRFNKNMIK